MLRTATWNVMQKDDHIIRKKNNALIIKFSENCTVHVIESPSLEKLLLKNYNYI